ncbi:MAG TPA: ParA family protein [Haliea salexigens]|uniref:ParA family protein n=1 Tax=Haliea salexigens TaxID=287487 RepID=A0A3C1KM95_9GAMM|nr:ParA family protein [Haliea salexigens]
MGARIMKVLAITAAKGGVGKSTLSVHMATLAEQAGERVLIADMDPQESASDWARVREKATPLVAPVDEKGLNDLVEAAKEEGITLLVIDTPPHAQASITKAARLADFTLVPCQPAPFDLRAVHKTLDMLEQIKARYSVVINAAPASRGYGEPPIVKEAREALSPRPIADPYITRRVAFSHALISGEAVSEFEPDGKAADEMATLWKWTKERLNGD